MPPPTAKRTCRKSLKWSCRIDLEDESDTQFDLQRLPRLDTTALSGRDPLSAERHRRCCAGSRYVEHDSGCTTVTDATYYGGYSRYRQVDEINQHILSMLLADKRVEHSVLGTEIVHH